MTDQHWHYERDGQKVGPFRLQDLQQLVKAGLIKPDTPLSNQNGDRMSAEERLDFKDPDLRMQATPCRADSSTQYIPPGSVAPPPPPPPPPPASRRLSSTITLTDSDTKAGQVGKLGDMRGPAPDDNTQSGQSRIGNRPSTPGIPAYPPPPPPPPPAAAESILPQSPASPQRTSKRQSLRCAGMCEHPVRLTTTDPRFPDSCVVCKAAHPDATVRLVTWNSDKNQNVSWWTLLFLGAGRPIFIRVPACPSCGKSLTKRRLVTFFALLMAFVIAAFIGLQFVSLEDRALKTIILIGAFVILFPIYTVLEAFLPQPIKLDVTAERTEYTFDDKQYAESFATLNSAQLYRRNSSNV